MISISRSSSNTARLRELLTNEEDFVALARWESDLAALDEIANVKDELSIGGAHNLELVQSKHGFPIEALEELGKSYAATVARLRGSEVVRRGLDEAALRPY